ncbi:SET domain-containing protein [Amylostereum chailletii]|nr:SET domain-containing protein [Amylostereum chailletii]
MTTTMKSPSDEELRSADNPALGITRFRALLLAENPNWTLSEARLRKVLQSEGLVNVTQRNASSGPADIYPTSRVIDDLDVEKWTSHVEVKFFDTRKGKGLVAKEKIAEGETIWKEDPFIIAPEWEIYDFQAASRHCAYCTTALSDSPLVVRCPSSTSDVYCPARFCTRLCHSRSAKTHPLLCPAQNPASGSVLSFARKNSWMGLHALVQCTARILLAGQAADATAFREDWKTYTALATLGMEERAKSTWMAGSEPDRPMWKKGHQLYLQAFQKPASPADQKKLARLLKKRLPSDIENALFPYDGFFQGVGRMSLNLETHGGLYTLHSHMNHDCTPNVSVRHLDLRTSLSRISLIAKRDIEPGEELVISYVNPELGLKARREALGAWNFGPCRCKRCLEEEKNPGEASVGAGGMDDLEKELKAGLGVM